MFQKEEIEHTWLLWTEVADLLILCTMKCRLCGVEKLSREFPREPLTEECTHPALYCLRCVTAKVKTEWKCPYTGCGLKIEEDNPCLKECEETLEFLFPEISASDGVGQYDQVSDTDQSSLTIRVTSLTGADDLFVYSPKKTIRDLKKEISDRTNVEPDKLRLVYNGSELKTVKTDGTAGRLSDYGVAPFSTIHLMVMLYAVPETLNHVIFDLSWSYPSHGRDFLDASCLMFMKDEWYSYVDWGDKYEGSSLWHSGDKMDDFRRIGKHRIEAKLKEIPLCVSHLVFTLSSFKAPTIAAFRNPSLKFYNAADETMELCQASFQNATNSQALIICCVSRTAVNSWRIDNGGLASAGNAKSYYLLKNTIQHLIKSNCFTGISLEPGTSRLTSRTPEQQRQFELECKRRLVS